MTPVNLSPLPDRRVSLLLLLAVVAVAFTVRALMLAQPIPTLLDKMLPDDAYYYFLTAQNIVAGEGASVDGLHPSNGWHPLWMLVNVGVFAVLRDVADLDLPVRVVLLIGIVCDSLVAGCLFIGLRRLSIGAAAVGGGLYAINVMPMFQALNGLETGLAALLLALAVLSTLRLIERPSAGRAAVWGVLFGLTFLARTDTALVLVCLGMFTLWRLRTRILWIALAGVLAVIVIAPWLAWNQANFGSPLEQVSSNAVPWAARARILADDPTASLLAEGLRVLTYPNYWLRGDYLGAPPVISIVLWIVGMVALIGAVRGPDEVARRVAHIALALMAGGALLVVAHTVVRWYPRPWYFVIMAQSLSFALGVFWFRTKQVPVRLGVLAVGLVGMVIFGLTMWQIGFYPWQSRHQYVAALWARDNLPAETRLASMNSGILGYYSGYTTVNLDGVVNPDAFAAIQDYHLFDFIRSAEVDYFIDSDYALRGEYALFMGANYLDGLREVQAITEEYIGLGSLRLYEVMPN